MFGAIVLAAGASTRFGSPKALATIGGRVAVTRVCRALYEVGIEDVAVVVGAHADRISPEVPLPARVVANPFWSRGRSTSVRAGVRALPPGVPFLVWPVDCPGVRTPTLKTLISGRGAIRVPRHDGKRGHPVVFEPSVRDELLSLRDDQPLHDVLHRDPTRVAEIDVDDPAVLWNVDTPDDLKKIDEFLRRPPNARPSA